MEKTISNIRIEITNGDITQQEGIDVVVNAANAELGKGGGVAGAIHKAAGDELEEEAVPKGPIKPGQAVITKAYNLPNEAVIHTLGPVYGKDTPEEKHLTNCYSTSLKLADEEGYKSIAFPAISTGAFGYPLDEACKVTVKSILDTLGDLSSINHIRLVLFTKKDAEAFESQLEKQS